MCGGSTEAEVYIGIAQRHMLHQNDVFSWEKSKAMPGLILLVQQQCGFVDICRDHNTIYVDNDDKLWTFLLDMDYLTGEINVTTASQCLSLIGLCMFCLSVKVNGMILSDTQTPTLAVISVSTSQYMRT